MLFEEVFIYGLSPVDSGPDDGLECQLIHDPWNALCQMKDQLDGVIDKEFFGSLGTFQMEMDVFASVIYGKSSEVMGEDNTLHEGLILGFSDAQGESLGP